MGSARTAYRSQRSGAAKRGIEWRFTFETWMDVWERSGRWAERGREAHNFCMARRGDIGPYSPDNVRIITVKENGIERMVNKPLSPEQQANRRGRGKGWTHRTGRTKPYQVMVGTRWVGNFSSIPEAEAAYALAWSEHRNVAGR